MVKPSSITGSIRVHSIDAFRALTMFLMIFVNDLWSLRNIPEWLEHVPAKVDGLGLADVVFPAFLVIVGFSIPFAISYRIKKGDQNLTITKHILIRSLALLIMGIFHVNLGNYNKEDALLPRPIWQILITIGFFLVWLDYSKMENKRKKTLLQISGILLLTFLALVFAGGTPENPIWMRFHWWGILGLIGWAYLIASFIYFLFREKPLVYLGFFLFFLFFNASDKLGGLVPIYPIKPYFWIAENGSMPAFSMAGVLVGVYYKNYLMKGIAPRYDLVLGIPALILILFGLITRPLWGIHKIGASPSWVTICIGISLIMFIFLIWLVDQKGKKDWFKLIKPAGTSTLTCYLLPYIHYGLLTLVGFSLPLILRTGLVGILKSLLYALIIILITGYLEKKKIRLKI